MADPELALAVASALLERGDHAAAAVLLGHARARGARAGPSAGRASPCPLPRWRSTSRGYAGTSRPRSRPAGSWSAPGSSTARRSTPACERSRSRTSASPSCGPARRRRPSHLERARGAAAEAGREWLVLISVAHLALLAATTADYARSARLARDAIALRRGHGWDRTWPAGGAYLALTTAEFLWDHSEDALHTLELARLALTTTQERPLRAGFALLRANGLAARGEPESAVAVLQTGAEELGDWPLLPAIRDQFAAREAVLRAELGEREQATGWWAAGGVAPPPRSCSPSSSSRTVRRTRRAR